tara:strand:- start:637 stop:1140 length:504 start_codon:yes stop_codon:yes gene_type:complete
MADRTIKPDSGNDLVVQNDDGTAKLELNEDQTLQVTSSTFEIDSSSNFKFNSGYGSVTTVYGVRAWITFNGDTNAILANGNISSITDHGGSGDYSINFTNNLVDANYVVSGTVSGNGAGSEDAEITIDTGTAPTTSACKFFVCSGHKPGVVAGAKLNSSRISLMVVR